jgi:hypothetical protein
MKLFNVIIDDESRYFATGLERSITEYARINNKVASVVSLGAAECGDCLLPAAYPTLVPGRVLVARPLRLPRLRKRLF